MWSHKCALKARGWCEKLTGWFSSAYSRDHTDILWSIRQKRSFKQNIYLITAELQQSKGPPNRAPYPYTKAKETHELIFSRLSWLVELLVGAYTWRQWWWPYSSKLSCFIASFFETGHQCYSQLTQAGKKYILTSVTWSLCGLKFRAHCSHVVLKWTDQVLSPLGLRGSDLQGNDLWWTSILSRGSRNTRHCYRNCG